jgi:divalent metal cation (Fe/Co/Zn/Cd) transporter
MDAAEPELLKRIAELLDRNRRDAWIDIHQLRAWRAGNLIHVDLHLILPRDLSLEDAHGEAKALEKLVMEAFGGRASVLIHTDPCTDPECPICRRYGCGLRREAEKGRPSWDASTLTMQAGQKASSARPVPGP